MKDGRRKNEEEKERERRNKFFWKPGGMGKVVAPE